MILADSHLHLDFPDFDPDREEVLHRARGAGVEYLNQIGTRLEEVPRLLELSRGIPEMRVVVGVHPHYADQAEATVERIVELADDPQVVGIGETGLDFYYDNSDRQRQAELFRYHIRAARRTGLPLVIHSRDAEAETRRILEEEGTAGLKGVFHCYTGSAEFAHWALEQGFTLSFSGIITFRNAEPLRRLAAQLPLERLLVETDAPYLAPIPHRGQRNEPAHVVRVAQAIAEARGIALERVAAATTANYLRLFRPELAGSVPPPPEIAAAGETLAYPIGDALYLNLSRGCTNRCTFCPKWTRPVVHHYDLTLHHTPAARELIAAMGDLTPYREVVFCGYGEPTLRLEVLLEVAAAIKGRGKRVRLNTDGLANRVHGGDITPRLAGLVDAVSVSLNAQDEATYNRHCHPTLSGAYPAILEFLRAVKAHVPQVTATVVEGLEGVDVAACRRLAEEELGVAFRVRHLGRVG